MAVNPCLSTICKGGGEFLQRHALMNEQTNGQHLAEHLLFGVAECSTSGSIPMWKEVCSNVWVVTAADVLAEEFQ